MDDLPPLYARWMREQVGHDLSREHVATCDRCVMLPPPDPVDGATYFEPATKCCTFLPELHNFLVGQILADPGTDPVGRASVVARIAASVEVTPLGLGRPRSYLLVYEDGGELTFGRSRGMRCPHYLDDGRCGVWAHRESTCATWFCKHGRGAAGYEQWRAVRRVLGLVEASLSWWCIRELGLDAEAITALLDLRRKRARVTARELWGRWAGREHEFYAACAARVEPLAWSEVLAICGPEVSVAADAVRAAPSEAPARLRLGALHVTAIRDGECTITTYSAYDPITLPLDLLAALDAFDGRPTAEVRAELAERRDVEIDLELLAWLVDFGVLVPDAPAQNRPE